MPIRNALASLAVKDLPAAIAWYARVLERQPDSRPMKEVAEWKFEGGGWLQVYQEPVHAGGGSCTLAVGGIDALAKRLEGLDVRGARVDSDKVRTLMVTDPDGNHIAFAEALDPTLAA